jgi:hypothetical protein
VSGADWSLVQRSTTEGGVSECDHEGSIMRRPRNISGCCYGKRYDCSENRYLDVRPIQSGSEIDSTNTYILCTLYEVVRSCFTSLFLSKFMLSSIGGEN